MSQTMSAALQTRLLRPAGIVLDKVNKWYGTMHVLRDVSLTLRRRNGSSSAARPGPASPP